MSDALDIAVVCEAGDWSGILPGAEEITVRAARAAWDLAAAPGVAPDGAELGIVLADDAMVRRLNRDYRGKDSPTNVLSFPAGDPGAPGRPRLIGDVVLALETVRHEAQAEGKSLADHVSHLVVHGVLHLLGHDHGTDAEAEEMEALEAGILAGLGIGNPYIPTEQPVG